METKRDQSSIVQRIGSVLIVAITLASCNPTVYNHVQKSDLKKDVELVTDFGPIVLRLSDKTPNHRNNFLRMVNLHELDSLDFYRVINSFLIQTGKDLPDSFPKTIDAEFDPELFHKRGALNAAREGDDTNPTQSSATLHFTLIQGRIYTDSLLDRMEKRINQWTAYNHVINASANKALFQELQKCNEDSTQKERLKYIHNELDSLTQIELTQMTLYHIPEKHRQVYKTIGGAAHLDQNYTVFGEVLKGMEVVDSIAHVATDSADKPLKPVYIKEARLIQRKQYK